MSELLLGIGLVLAIEGFLYAAFPGALKQMIALAGDLPDQKLRMMGLAALAAGVFFVWLARG